MTSGAVQAARTCTPWQEGPCTWASLWEVSSAVSPSRFQAQSYLRVPPDGRLAFCLDSEKAPLGALTQAGGRGERGGLLREKKGSLPYVTASKSSWALAGALDSLTTS